MNKRIAIAAALFAGVLVCVAYFGWPVLLRLSLGPQAGPLAKWAADRGERLTVVRLALAHWGDPQAARVMAAQHIYRDHMDAYATVATDGAIKNLTVGISKYLQTIDEPACVLFLEGDWRPNENPAFQLAIDAILSMPTVQTSSPKLDWEQAYDQAAVRYGKMTHEDTDCDRERAWMHAISVEHPSVWIPLARRQLQNKLTGNQPGSFSYGPPAE